MPLFITRDTWTQVRGCKVLEQQSSRESMAFGTYCGTSPPRTLPLSLHPSILTATHLTPLTLGEARLDTWTRVTTVVAYIGTNGYIAICTVATINLPPSITALERDSPIYERLPLRFHACFTLESYQLACSPYAAHENLFDLDGFSLERASCKIQLSGD